jgi:hypothetical protein
MAIKSDNRYKIHPESTSRIIAAEMKDTNTVMHTGIQSYFTAVYFKEIMVSSHRKWLDINA